MKIVLATLHVRRSAQAVPLAAACVAAVLPQPLRATTELLDFFPENSLEQMTEEILSRRPDLVAFPLYAWSRKAVLSLARRLRQARPELRLLAGGPEATADPAGVLADGALDGVIRGEGETTFASLAETLALGGDPAGQPGLSWKTSAGIITGPDVAPAELERLLSPWLAGVLTPPPGSGVLWEVSRGCSFGCDFCFEGKSRKVRHLPAGRLEAELDLFVRADVAQIWILDSTFNFPPERGKNLLRLLARRAPHIHFHLEAKAEFLDRETVRLLSRLFCSVQLGFQSARPKVLRLLHRSLDPALFADKVHLLNAEGVTFGLDLIYGLPGDDYAGFCASLDTALGFVPNTVDLFPLAVLPGTSLHLRRHELGLRAQEEPPYEIIESASYSAADLGRSRRLAAATNLFYNLGRAVAFFPPLLRAVNMTPSAFLSGFADWALAAGGIDEERFARLEAWRPADVLPLQEGYAEYLLRRGKRPDLLPAALDLIRYHYYYAETLLGAETLPAAGMRQHDLWDTRWRLAPGVTLVPFTYEILELQETGDVDLAEFTSLFRPVGSVALFLRRDGQVVCESLEENFLKLLRACNGRLSPRQIFAGSISAQEGEEIVEFAVNEGFLVPAEKN
jgi:hypothetical protein